MTQPPEFPAGPFSPAPEFDDRILAACKSSLKQAPQKLRTVVRGLTSEQLETKYRNWSIRQIVHHLADSHLHSIIRFKWALTENHPTIKAYEEGDWIQLTDCRVGEIEPSLLLLEGLHTKWGQVLDSMTRQDFSRTFFHPQSEQSVDLWTSVQTYSWHSQHHTAQIQWIKDQQNW